MDKYEKNLKSILYQSFEALVHFINEGLKGTFQLCSSPNARLYDLKTPGDLMINQEVATLFNVMTILNVS